MSIRPVFLWTALPVTAAALVALAWKFQPEPSANHSPASGILQSRQPLVQGPIERVSTRHSNARPGPAAAVPSLELRSEGASLGPPLGGTAPPIVEAVPSTNPEFIPVPGAAENSAFASASPVASASTQPMETRSAHSTINQSRNEPATAPQTESHGSGSPAAELATDAAPGNSSSIDRSFGLEKVQSAPVVPPKPPVLPLVFTEADPAAAGITLADNAALEEVREQFWKDIGAGELDPASREYRARWERAQPVADQLLRAIVGQQRFQQYQLQAAYGSPVAGAP